MIRLLVVLACVCACTFGHAQTLSRQEVRTNFKLAIDDQDVAEDLIETLAPIEKPLLQAYRGATHTLMADHCWNPVTKFDHFKKGIALIDQAIIDLPNCIELRYIRFMIQANAPGFLGYNTQIENDKDLMIEKLTSGDLMPSDREMIEEVKAYLLASSLCESSEKKALEAL